MKVSFLARERDLSFRTVPYRDRDRDRDIYAAGTTPIRFHDHGHDNDHGHDHGKNETFTVSNIKDRLAVFENCLLKKSIMKFFFETFTKRLRI